MTPLTDNFGYYPHHRLSIQHIDTYRFCENNPTPLQMQANPTKILHTALSHMLYFTAWAEHFADSHIQQAHTDTKKTLHILHTALLHVWL